ncbi:MAG: arylesterase [Chthoniobacterales bacterium]
MRNWKVIYAAGHCAITAFCLFAKSAEAAPRDASHVKTVLALGDSLTAGFRLERRQAYPALLSEKIRGTKYDCEVINAGVSGDTSAGGLQRLPTYLRRRIDVLILELGINDAFRGIPVDQIRANLQSIIDQTKARSPNVQIIIAGMQLPQFTSDPYVAAFAAIFADLAEKNHAALIPYFLEGIGGDPEMNLGDGIHPNAAGQRLLAERVWRLLEPILQNNVARDRPRVN